MGQTKKKALCKKSDKYKNAPEIRELERAEALVDEDIVGLDVGMHKAPRGHVLQRCHKLLGVLLDGVNVDARLSQTNERRRGEKSTSTKHKAHNTLHEKGQKEEKQTIHQRTEKTTNR